MLRLQLLRSLRTQRCCASIDALDRTEVEFVQKRFVLYHGDNDWRYLREIQVLAELDLGSRALELFRTTVI